MTRRKPLPSPLTPQGHVARYRARSFDDTRHDPYQLRGKYAETTRCTQCGAVYERGRWRWGVAPQGAHAGMCTACQRVRDKLPAGLLNVEGPYVTKHGAELVGIARNEAEREASEHPMNRIMNIDEGEERIEIATTDIHLPQRIGEALKHAHQGSLDVEYAGDEYSVRVRWHR